MIRLHYLAALYAVVMNNVAMPEDDGRIRVHPAVLQILGVVMLAVGGMIAGYYKGALDQMKEASALQQRVVVVETHAAETEKRQGEILAKLDEVTRAIVDLRVATKVAPPQSSVAFPRFDK